MLAELVVIWGTRGIPQIRGPCVSGARTPPPARNLASDFFILRSLAKGLDLRHDRRVRLAPCAGDCDCLMAWAEVIPRRRPATVPENPNGHVDDEETAGLDGHRQPVVRAAPGGRPGTAPHPENASSFAASSNWKPQHRKENVKFVKIVKIVKGATRRIPHALMRFRGFARGGQPRTPSLLPHSSRLPHALDERPATT
jgi:hypothetical protein